METNYFSLTLLALWAAMAGAFLCGVYDILRAFRISRSVKSKGIFLFIWDFLFCMLATVCMLLLFFNLTYGKARVYAFAFCGLGFVLWRITLGRLFTALLIRLIGWLSRLFEIAKNRLNALCGAVGRRIYTKNYCRRLVNRSATCFGMIKRKELKNEHSNKTDES